MTSLLNVFEVHFLRGRSEEYKIVKLKGVAC